MGIRYFACFLFAVVYAIKIDIMWLTDNVSGHYKHATMIGVTIAFANISGIIMRQTFREQSKPRYIKGLVVTLGNPPSFRLLMILQTQSARRWWLFWFWLMECIESTKSERSYWKRQNGKAIPSRISQRREITAHTFVIVCDESGEAVRASAAMILIQ